MNTTKQWKTVRIKLPVCYALVLVQQLVGCLPRDAPSKCDKPLKFVPWERRVDWQIHHIWVMSGITMIPCKAIHNWPPRSNFSLHASVYNVFEVSLARDWSKQITWWTQYPRNLPVYKFAFHWRLHVLWLCRPKLNYLIKQNRVFRTV